MGTITICTILHVGTVAMLSMLNVECLSACGLRATAIYALSLSTTSGKPCQIRGTASARNLWILMSFEKFARALLLFTNPPSWTSAYGPAVTVYSEFTILTPRPSKYWVWLTSDGTTTLDASFAYFDRVIITRPDQIDYMFLGQKFSYNLPGCPSKK